MSTNLDLFGRLATPFGEGEVRTRNQSGRTLHYVTARTVMNRLDEVLGAENWWDDYIPWTDSSVLCRLTIRLPGGEVLTKCDAGGMSTTADASDFEKSGFSDAFKRAAVKFGVGRYLYGDGVPPSIRDAARAGRAELDPEPPPPPDRPRPPAPADDRPSAPPKSGKALFAWVKERDEKMGVDLLKHLSDWGKAQRFPARMVQWAGDQVDQAHSEALRMIAGLKAGGPADATPDPATGRELYDWARHHGAMEFMEGIGRSFGHPSKIVDWDGDQVRAGLHEYRAKGGATGRQRAQNNRPRERPR